MSTGTATPSNQETASKAATEKVRYLGLGITTAAFFSLFVSMRAVGLPLSFSASSFFERYAAVAVQSIVYALLLAAIGFPAEVLRPIKKRFAEAPAKLMIVVLLGVLFYYLYPVFAATLFLIIGIAVLEAYERAVSPGTLARPLLPGLYLFVGLVTVFGYNAVIVTVRFYPNYDHTLRVIDSYLLLGHSVSELAHRFNAVVPSFVSNGLMISYMALFAQIGAALLLTSIKVGRSEGMRFVSAILLAYVISMAIFVSFPTHSPYFTCVDHASASLPKPVIEAQEGLMALADARWNRRAIPIDTEYYIAFPCMHIAQPLIVLWFLRKWRRIALTLVAVDVVLAFAIVFLEWHYVADLLGGVAVAVVSVLLMEWLNRCRSKWLPSDTSRTVHPSANLSLS